MDEMTDQEKFDAICRFVNDHLPENWQEEIWSAMGNHMASVFDQSPGQIRFERDEITCAYRPSVVQAAEYAIHTLAPSKVVIYVNGQVVLQHD